MKNSIVLSASLFFAVAVSPQFLSAADRTWSGGGADALWSTAGNWGGTAPVASDALLFDGALKLLSTNDLAADTSFAGLTFLSSASSFTLTGNRIALGGNIVNQSPVTQTIGLPLVINATADRFFNTATGAIVVTSSLAYTNLGTTARYYKKTGSNELVFTGATLVTNLYSRLSLEEGTLRFAPGSRFYLVDFTGERNLFRIGDVANKKTAMVVESGADVALGGWNLQTTSVTGGTGTFDLSVYGKLLFTGSDNTFGDQPGNRVTCVIDNGGTLQTVSNAQFNVGTRIPMTLTLNNGSVWLGNLYTGRSATGDRPGSFRLFINKGSFFVQNDFGWMNSTATSRTNMVTLGSGTRGEATLSTLAMKQDSATGTTILNLNGGILECRSDSANFLSGLDEVNLLAGGVIVDTGTNSVTITEKILRDPALSLEVRDGGLVKRGTGSLTFSGLTNQFNGPLRVENGSLRISSSMLSNPEEIYLAPGKTLSFRGSYRQTLAPERLVLGDAATASRLDFDVSASDLSCDSIHIPAGGYVGKLNIYLKQRGSTDVDFGTPGDYPVFTYATEPPDLALLTHANRTASVTSAFVVNRVSKQVLLRLTAMPPDTSISTWTNTTSGAWELSGNWTPGAPANAPESRARFWSAITAPSTVTLSTDTRIGGISFNHSQSYTLAGAGVLTLGDQSGAGYLSSDAGSHTVDLALSLTNPITMNVPASQTLTLNGTVSGSGRILKGSPGTLLLTNANTFAGGITVSGGTLAIPAAETLGSGPLTLAGGTARSLAPSLTLDSRLRVQASSTLDTGTNSVRLDGLTDWTGSGTLIKHGSGELVLAGSCSENNATALFNFRQGVTRLVNGATYSLRGANRDVLQTTYNASGQTSTLIIEPGATFNAGGLRLMTGDAQGTSTVYVAGGQLNLLDAECTIVNVTGGRGDIRVDNGGSLYAANSWFCLGVYGLGTLTVSNGAASVGLLTMGGYADNVAGGNRQGSAAVTVGSGGTFEVRDYLTWLTDNQNLTAWVRLAGGRLTIPATTRSVGSTGTARLVLDGGTLVCSGTGTYVSPYAPAPSLTNYLCGVNELLLGAGGVTFDTRLHAVTITQPLTMEAGASAAAGFTKTGAGSLTLAGANTFNAPVTVASGSLVLTALPSNSLAVSAGARLTPSANSLRTEFLSEASFATGAALEADLGTSDSSDRLAVSGTLTLGSRLDLFVNGEETGTFTLFTYGTLSGSVSALRVANPDPDVSYTFADTGSALTLTVSANPNAASWAADADGLWNTAANWTPQSAPGGAGHAARFDLAFTAPRTVTLDSSVTLGSLLFDSATAPAITGANNTLTMNNGTSAPALIEADQGAPVVGPALALPADTFALIDPSASLTLAGNISGSGSLNAVGGGALILAGTNTASQTRVNGSTLTLAATGSQDAPLTLENAILASLATKEIAAAITASAFGATVAPASGTTLTLSGTLGGEGGISKIGSSTLSLSGALAYQGTTFANGGTLSLATLPPAALTLGAGTFAYEGASSLMQGYTVNVGTGSVAAVLNSDANLTVTGAVVTASGGFVKTGSGTLAFTYSGAQTLGLANGAAPQDALLNIGANGDAPTQGFGPFTVANGTVTLGAPGQVNTVGGNLNVGIFSTVGADSETAAHLIITGGTTTVGGSLAVGRGNGNSTTAPTPRQSSLTIEDGVVNAAALAVGHNGGNTTGFNAHPVVTVNGGTVNLTQFNFAEHFGCVGSFTLNGGVVNVSDLVRVGHQSSSGGGGTGTLTVNGGTLSVANDIDLGTTSSATGTLYLAGGLTSARNVIVGSGRGSIVFDGGTLRLVNGPMDKPQSLKVMDGGAHLDVQSGRFTLSLPLLAGEAGDGGLVKTGQGMLALDGSLSHTYAGPTVVSEGTLAMRSQTAAPLPAGTALSVLPGAAFHASSEVVTAPRTVAVSALTLGAPAPASNAGLALWLSASNQGDMLAVSGPVSLGRVAVFLYEVATLDPALYNGAYPIITYTGPDPDVSGLTVANPRASRSYTFSVDSGNKRVMLTIADGSGAADALWTRDADGNWSTGANWQSGTAPTTITAPAQFANVLSQGRTVTVDAPATVGGLTFDASNRYTLVGSQTITLSGANAALTLERGSHTVAAPLEVAGSGSVALAPSGNTLTLAGPVSGSGAVLTLATAGTLLLSNSVVDTALTVSTGALELATSADVNGTLRYNGGQISATGNATVDGAVELPPGNRSLRVNSGATLTVNGPVLGQGTLLKDNGSGTLTLAASSSYAGGTRVSNGTLSFSGSGTPGSGPVVMSGGMLAASGSAPVAFNNPIGFTNNTTVWADAPFTTGGALTTPGPRELTKDGTNVWSIGGSFSGVNNSYRLFLRDGTVRFAAGSSFRMDSPDGSTRDQFSATIPVTGAALGMMIESNATVTLGSIGAQFSGTSKGAFNLIVNGGRLALTGSNPLGLGDQSNMLISVTCNGGEFVTTRDDAWCDIGTRSPVSWTMNGGWVSLGRPAFGRQDSQGTLRLYGGVTLAINGGTFEAREFFSWKSTDYSAVTNTVTLGNGTPKRGRFSIPATKRYHAGGRVVLNMNGGVLETRGLCSATAAYNGSLTDYLYGVNDLNVLPGGAVIDTLTNTLTITHTFTAHASGDGGLTKLGSGTLTLSADLALTGQVTVAQGVLDAAFTAAPSLAVNAGGVLDLTQTVGVATFSRVSGAGLVTNGTLAVSGSLSPGDTAGAAGAFRVRNLTFAPGSTLRYDWSVATNDLFAVSGLLTAGGGGYIDFAREVGDAIPVPLNAVLGTTGSFGGNFAGWKAINTGLPQRAALATSISVQNGLVLLNVKYGGMVLLLR